MIKTAEKIIYYILIMLGAIGIINMVGLSLTTNFNLGNLLPGLAGIFLSGYGTVKLWNGGKPIIGNVLLRRIISIVFAAAFFFFVIIQGLIIFNGSSQENVEADYLIILGAGINGDTVSLALKWRLDKGIEYLNAFPGAMVIVSGGQGPGELISEAEAMKRYLLSAGIEPDRILTENKSTSTMENFLYSKEIIENGTRDSKNIMIITNDFHMFRAKMLARRAGFNPSGISSSTPAPIIFSSYTREFFALIKSYYMDKEQAKNNFR